MAYYNEWVPDPVEHNNTEKPLLPWILGMGILVAFLVVVGGRMLGE